MLVGVCVVCVCGCVVVIGGVVRRFAKRLGRRRGRLACVLCV